MKVSDYIAQKLVEHGVRHIWMITGGGAMHLNDSLGRDLEYICCHHEQACAMAAEAYARLSGKIGVLNVTTGPGGINTLNGVFGAYTDSIPMLIISGQVKRETGLGAHPNWPGRQLGDQEAKMVEMARPVTKYAVLVDDPQTIRYHLERALWLAENGRPGPCWLDIPVDVQGAQIEPETLLGYDASEDAAENPVLNENDVLQVLARLNQSERPVILAGHGLRMSGANDLLLQFAERLQIPVCAAWDAADAIPNSHPNYAGRPGTVGERAGNFNLQNADVVLIIGCRCNIRQVSYNWDNFARAAFKIQVDIDPLELDKPTVKPDLGVCADAKEFLQNALNSLDEGSKTHGKYLQWCRERVARFSAVNDEQRAREDAVSGYAFVEKLSAAMNERDIIVTANGAASVMTMQAVELKNGNRVLSNSGSASMGYDLPAAVGACIANERQRVICLAGDGSIMMNLQELQTIAHHRLPVKIFVWNNGLYLSIRTTQMSFFGGHLVGESAVSGVSAPDFVTLARAFGIDSSRLETGANMEEHLAQIIAADGPHLCEVMMPHDELMLPKTSSVRLPDGRMFSKPLEDMFPFLERDEFAANMIIEPMPEV